MLLGRTSEHSDVLPFFSKSEQEILNRFLESIKTCLNFDYKIDNNKIIIFIPHDDVTNNIRRIFLLKDYIDPEDILFKYSIAVEIVD